MRRLAWLSAILLLVAAPAFAQPGWTRHELEGGAVSVNLPTAPTRSEDKATTDSGQSIPTTIYMAVSGDVLGIVMVSPAPAIADVKTAFDFVVATRIGAANLISRQDLTVDGSPAMLVVFRQNGAVIHDLVVYRDDKLYQFLTGVAEGQPAPPHAEAFHRSVKFRTP